MSEQDRTGGGLATGEHAQLIYALETRLAPHLEAADAAVRQTKRDLEAAQDRLAMAEQTAASSEYVSDPLPFMRQGVAEEVDGLDRRSNEKKVRSGYRFLLDRAVDLAAAEVQRFHDDEATAQRDREAGVEACRAAVERAAASVESAQLMQERVLDAERAARQGLELMARKLSSG